MNKTEAIHHLQNILNAIDMLPDENDIEIHISLTKDFKECAVYDMKSTHRLRFGK